MRLILSVRVFTLQLVVVFCLSKKHCIIVWGCKNQENLCAKHISGEGQGQINEANVASEENIKSKPANSSLRFWDFLRNNLCVWSRMCVQVQLSDLNLKTTGSWFIAASPTLFTVQARTNQLITTIQSHTSFATRCNRCINQVHLLPASRKPVLNLKASQRLRWISRVCFYLTSTEKEHREDYAIDFLGTWMERFIYVNRWFLVWPP